MAVETEIKLRLSDAASARKMLDQCGYQPSGPRTLETDQVYDRPSRDLQAADQLLRMRSSGNRWTLTFKGPRQQDRYKSREEIELDVSEGGALSQILIALGFSPSFRYEKFRTKFTAPGEPGIVMLDETPIGDFLELEGPGYWIDQTATSLGFSPAEYVTLSYAALYREYCHSHGAVPEEMKFYPK